MSQGVQSSYRQRILKAEPGQIADLQPKILKSGKANGTALGYIEFGVVVAAGINPDEIRLVSTFPPIGITVRDIARENDQNGKAFYDDKETASYMVNGYVYCVIDGVGSAGDSLTYEKLTGKLSTAPPGPFNGEINACLDEDCNTSGDITRVFVYVDAP